MSMMSDRIFLAGLGEDEPHGPDRRPYKRRLGKQCSCISDDAQWQWIRMDVCTIRPPSQPVGGSTGRDRVLDPGTLVNFLRAHARRLVEDVQENILVVPINSRGQAIGIAHVHRGGRAVSMVELSSVFQPVVATPPATRFIVAHNHPTGNVSPSPEDIDRKDRLKDASGIVGIVMTDFIIVGPQTTDGYYSFVEAGRMR